MSGDALERPGGAPGQRGALTCSLKLIPKNMLLPAGLRQRDQTKKSPTGPLDREALLQYLEQQALEVKERDDLVPFTGEKKGMGSLTSMPLSRHNQAGHAVGDARACCKESNAHDDIGDPKGVSNNSHLQKRGETSTHRGAPLKTLLTTQSF